MFWLGGSKFTSGKPEKQQQKPSNYNPETDKAANKKVNGISDNATTIARYTYDDAEGVVNTRVHELSKLLTQTTYSYDERARLDSIITKNLTVTPSSPELMKHLYHYDGSVPLYGGQYMPQSGLSYNGNINAVLSSYNFSGVYGSAPSQFNYATVYGYKYDRLNRLTDADGFVGDFVVAAMALGTNPTIAAVQIGDERYTYDKIGNIRTLKRTIRHSDPLDNTVVSKNENWTYQYDGYNKLTQVTTGGSALLNRNYTYDKNGNLLTDSYREIAATEYGRTAYPYYLEADNNEIYYLYSVDDQRMYKKVVTPTETTTEFYLQDATGKTVALRRKVGSAAATWEYYVNGSEREARIKNVTHNGMIAAQEIEFYLYDHLGNTRVVYEPTYAGGVLELAINYAADYFPYGKVLREYVNTSTGDPEKFLTTQHERDKETGLDYRGARFYDSDVARFLSIDPLQKDYPSFSTYHYVMGNPISLIDPTGKGAESTHIDKSGKVIAVFNDGDNGVYQHGDNADGGTPTEYMISRRQEKWGTSANGTKVGTTKYWDEFVNIESGKAEGVLKLGESWDKAVETLHNSAMKNMNLYQIAEASRPNKALDIKSNTTIAPFGVMTGRLLNGEYATARSAGNYLAGMNGRHGTIAGENISQTKYMMLAGALDKGVYSKKVAGLIVSGFMTTKQWPWPAPYYGEDEYSGRRILEGWNKK